MKTKKGTAKVKYLGSAYFLCESVEFSQLSSSDAQIVKSDIDEVDELYSI